MGLALTSNVQALALTSNVQALALALRGVLTRFGITLKVKAQQLVYY